jgi:hypothetical protein
MALGKKIYCNLMQQRGPRKSKVSFPLYKIVTNFPGAFSHLEKSGFLFLL